MLTPEQEQNKQQIHAMLKERKKRLSETDRRSLQRAINSLTNFGNDFSIYRTTNLSDVPNTVITGLCHILKEHGFPVYLPREADRYNEISTLCIQETWNSCLKHIFQCTKFLNLAHLPREPAVSDLRPVSEIYYQALCNYEAGDQAAMVATFLKQRETNKVTHFVGVHSKLLSIVATFEKRGSAHKLLAYSIRNGDETTFFDIRNKNTEKRALKITTKIPRYSTKPAPEFTPISQIHVLNPVSIHPLNPLPSLDQTAFDFTPSSLLQPIIFQKHTNDFVVPTKKSISPLPSISDLMYFKPPVSPTIKLPSILTQII